MIDSAANQLTKTAIVVTCIFMVCLGYEMFYYTLGTLQVFSFVLNSPQQKVNAINIPYLPFCPLQSIASSTSERE